MIYDGQTSGEVIVSVVGDEQPELDEIFIILLTSVDGGARLGDVNLRRSFVIRSVTSLFFVLPLQGEI